MPSSRARLAAIACLAGVALLTTSSARAEEPRVGVVVALTVNASGDRAVELAGTLGDVLAEELAVRVVAGEEASRRLPREGISDGCIGNRACVRDLGERLDAGQLLVLVVVEVGERIQIDPTWVDVGSGRTVSREAISFAREDGDPGEVFRRRAPKLLPHVARRSGSRDPPRKDPPGDAAGDPQDSEVAGGTGPDGGDGDAGGAEAPGAGGLPAKGPGGAAAGTSQEAPEGRHMTPIAWTAAGVGGAALFGGIGFALATQNRYDRCEAEGCDDGERDEVGRLGLTADILLGAAAVSGVAAAVLYWTSGEPEDTRTLGVTAGPGDVGLAVGGRF